MRKRFGRNDLILLLSICLVIICISVFIVIFGRDKGGYVTITVDGEVYLTVPLDPDCQIEIANTGGEITNYLSIKDGIADMTDASCPDRLCVKQKSICYNNESIICLPNRVVVTVSSDNDSDIDVMAK